MIYFNNKPINIINMYIFIQSFPLSISFYSRMYRLTKSQSLFFEYSTLLLLDTILITPLISDRYLPWDTNLRFSEIRYSEV